jgi:hypothetical protein
VTAQMHERLIYDGVETSKDPRSSRHSNRRWGPPLTLNTHDIEEVLRIVPTVGLPSDLPGLRRFHGGSILAACVGSRRDPVGGRQQSADPLGRAKGNARWSGQADATVALSSTKYGVSWARP